MCETYANKHTCNIRSKKQMKHSKRMLATYMYNHCNMCNIPIYFCNIYIKYMQHTSKTSETIETYFCNVRFQHNISLLFGKMEARRCLVFTRGSGLAALVGRGQRQWHYIAEGRHQPHEQGGCGRVTWRGQPRAAPRTVGSRALRLGGGCT
jgi:hypothetical protein